jgi:hypothetical protein
MTIRSDHSSAGLGLAIAGFVCSCLCAPLGLVLSILAFRMISRGEAPRRGRSLAIASIVLSSCLLLAGVGSQLWQMHRVTRLSQELGDARIERPTHE